MNSDENLRGNEAIVEAMREMAKDPKEETLAHVLTVIRHRMKENGHFVVAVHTQEEQLSIRTVGTKDGRKWIAAFTDMDEQLKKKDQIVSGFTAEIRRTFEMALETEGISGVIVNPWDNPLMMDHQVILLVMGN